MYVSLIEHLIPFKTEQNLINKVCKIKTSYIASNSCIMFYAMQWIIK